VRPPPGSRKAQLIENLIGGNLLGAAEDINLGHVGEAQFMNLDLRAEGHEADEGVIGKKANGATKRGFEKLDLLLDETGVEEEEENGGRVEGIGEGEDVLDGGVLGVEFAGEVGFGDGVVVRGEVVALVAEGADPDLGGEVDAGEGVEGGGAGFAAERGVLEAGDVRVGTDEGDGGGERDDALAGFDLGAGPHVPRHAHSVDTLGIWARHLRHPRSLTRGTGNCISHGNNSLTLFALQFSILPAFL